MPAAKQRILVVDDEKDIVNIVKKGLELKGFEVDGFTDPVEAIDQFKPFRYDVAFIDIRMPRLNGFGFYRRIRKQDDKIRTFLMSAFEIPANESQLAFPYLAPISIIIKPISIDQLVQLIEAQPTVKLQ